MGVVGTGMTGMDMMRMHVSHHIHEHHPHPHHICPGRPYPYHQIEMMLMAAVMIEETVTYEKFDGCNHTSPI